MNIVIRADASIHIGTGHVMRCLTLADELKKRGAATSFICRDENGNLNNFIKNKNHKVFTLPANIDIDADRELTRKILEQENPDWLIIDHYGIDSAWESFQRNTVGKIMVIDDLADRMHDCDLLLDQNYNEYPERYQKLAPSECTKLLGPEYALLRPQFSRGSNNLRDRTGEVKRILVSMGGADPGNQTSRVLRAIKTLCRDDITIDTVIGPSASSRNEIESMTSGQKNVTCHYNVDNMAELMDRSDLAIGAGGITTWERSCLALPSMVISIAENQRETAVQLSNRGYIIYTGDSDTVTEREIANDISFLLRHPEIIRQLSLKTRRLTDGKGAERVGNFLLACPVS